jgi:hypothetical protein
MTHDLFISARQARQAGEVEGEKQREQAHGSKVHKSGEFERKAQERGLGQN